MKPESSESDGSATERMKEVYGTKSKSKIKTIIYHAITV